MTWIFNKLWPLLEPKLEELINSAVDRAVAGLTNVLETEAKSIEDTVLAALRKLPILGGLI